MDRIKVVSADEELRQLVSGDLHKAVYISRQEEIKLSNTVLESGAGISRFEFLQKMNPISKFNLDNPNQIEIEIEVNIPAMLVLTEVWYPGWQATVDNKPTQIYRVNYCQRGVWLEKGKHRVMFRFRPLAWRRGAVISLMTAGLMSLSLIVSFLIKIREK